MINAVERERSEYFQKLLKQHNMIAWFYKDFVPTLGCCFDTNHKNWHIYQGASYADCILLNYGKETLKKVIDDKDISIVKDKLRQDKILNKYFWIGAKLVLNAKVKEILEGC